MNYKLFPVLLLLIAALVVAGCNTPIGDNQSNNYSDGLDMSSIIDVPMDDNETKDNMTDEPEEPEEKDEPEEIDESKASFTIEAIEGELVKIPVKAVDPDGDFLEYTFEKPFNEKGLWQSEIGDEGKHLVKVSVSDGKLSTSEYVLVELGRANRPPTIECPEEVNVQEGDTVVLDCNVFDVDGDVVLVGYDGWMKTSSYKTTFGDAGTHTVIVRAKDQTKDSVVEVEVNVKKKNRLPVLSGLTNAEGIETEEIELEVEVSDPDGDDVTVVFSEPFDKKGTWTPSFGDAGTYDVTVSASDGEDIIEETIEVVISKKNRAPVIKEFEPIEVDEGETIKLNVKAFDPDGDDLVISYEGLMDSSEYETTFDDAYENGCDEKGCSAEYTVTVTASDGALSAEEKVVITINDQNRPPEFIFG